MSRITLALLVATLAGPLRAQEEEQPLVPVEPMPVAEEKPAPEPETRVFGPPSVEDVRAKVVDWLAQQTDATDEQRHDALALWAEVPADENEADRLDRVIATFAAAHAETAEFVKACDLLDPPLVVPESDVIDDLDNDFHAQNLRAWYGRYLVRRRMYDEALWSYEEIDPALVIDPATCLFNRAVCEQHLLMREEASRTLTTLLENTESVPPRYSTVATLMKYRLQSLRPESLDEVAHLMNDVENRLDLGRAGQRVQKKEERIVAVLDKIIEKLEAGGGGGGGGGEGDGKGKNQSSAPAQASKIMGEEAPGNVDEKNTEERDVWGSLPPRVATRTKNIIDRNFPPHYQRAIEKFTKQAAKRVVTGD